jgi:2-succinyl-6-hydroxy-2,4-cyclohexadiene-1-carboxylate synthase
LKKLADEWDAQSVFCGIENRALRNLDDLDPENLSRQFDVFSKARQRNLVPDLAKLENPPILFLSGEEDLKYRRIGEELAEACSAVHSKVLRHAGHRAPWENPESFVQVLIDFAFG